MPVLEKCFEPFSDEEAFANLPKNIFGERRENKLQTTFWPGTDEGFRRRVACLSQLLCRRQGLRTSQSRRGFGGPLSSLTQDEGLSRERTSPWVLCFPDNCPLITNWKGRLSPSAPPGGESLTRPDDLGSLMILWKFFCPHKVL